MVHREHHQLSSALWPLIAGVVAAACDSGSTSGCVIGPCDTTGGDTPIPVVAGFPSARAFSGVGRLAPGDEVTFYAIRIRPRDDPCVGADTLRANVQWGVSNPTAATVTPLSDGGVRVRAVAQGTFQVFMREGGSGPLSTSFDTKIVFSCPAGLTISNIGVSP
jgi:hypothetical protein